MYKTSSVMEKICLLVSTNGYCLSSWSIFVELLENLEQKFVYIHDVLKIQKVGSSEEDHIKKIEQVLEQLDAKGFCANLWKSFFMQKEAKSLGYLSTASCLKPRPKKIEAMNCIIYKKNAK